MNVLAPITAGVLWLLTACGAAAQSAAPPVTSFAATGTVQYAFTPGSRADDMLIAAINTARQQVLIQAYSFSHRRIAEALVGAHGRGVEVVVIADREQAGAKDSTRIMHKIASSGAGVLLDSQHASAHNKIIVIDASQPNCAVVTGSLNFTYAAQHRNAENVVLLRGNAALCEAYRHNWQRHREHSLPFAG